MRASLVPNNSHWISRFLVGYDLNPRFVETAKQRFGTTDDEAVA